MDEDTLATVLAGKGRRGEEERKGEKVEMEEKGGDGRKRQEVKKDEKEKKKNGDYLLALYYRHSVFME